MILLGDPQTFDGFNQTQTPLASHWLPASKSARSLAETKRLTTKSRTFEDWMGFFVLVLRGGPWFWWVVVGANKNHVLCITCYVYHVM